MSNLYTKPARSSEVKHPRLNSAIAIGQDKVTAVGTGKWKMLKSENETQNTGSLSALSAPPITT